MDYAPAIGFKSGEQTLCLKQSTTFFVYLWIREPFIMQISPGLFVFLRDAVPDNMGLLSDSHRSEVVPRCCHACRNDRASVRIEPLPVNLASSVKSKIVRWARDVSCETMLSVYGW
jgi:hypothetical protein